MTAPRCMGPLIFQFERFASPSTIHAPLRVPTSMRCLVIPFLPVVLQRPIQVVPLALRNTRGLDHGRSTEGRFDKGLNLFQHRIFQARASFVRPSLVRPSFARPAFATSSRGLYTSCQSSISGTRLEAPS